jgi:hypothetical protein
MSSIKSRIIKVSDNETKSDVKNQKEIFHDSQLVYLWELHHSKDIKEQSYMKEEA